MSEQSGNTDNIKHVVTVNQFVTDLARKAAEAGSTLEGTTVRILKYGADGKLLVFNIVIDGTIGGESVEQAAVSQITANLAGGIAVGIAVGYSAPAVVVGLAGAIVAAGFNSMIDFLWNWSEENYIPDMVANWFKSQREFVKQQEAVIEAIKAQTQTASVIRSPIILDLDGNGISTVGFDTWVHFDHDGNGFAQLTGWVGANDGLLVWDRNGNGVIDDGGELFGDNTVLFNGLTAVNGFAALAEHDRNGDGVIDANDAIWSELRIWRDLSQDGRTDEGELFTLEEAGVQSINVTYTNSNYVDANGNSHKQVGSYTTTTGEHRVVADVWFKTDATYSLPTELVEVPEDIAQLPDAQGYGTVRDLHQAMALDESGKLKEFVSSFVAAETPHEREALLTQIIYHWAGVQDIDPNSRASRMIYGNAIGDARRLEALEAFMGSKWVGIWCWNTLDPNPHGRAAPVLLKAWDDLKALVYGQLMVQSHLKGLFQLIRYGWDDETQTIDGDLSDVAAVLGAQIESDRDAGLELLSEFVRSLRGLGIISAIDMTGFKSLLIPLGGDVEQTLVVALSGWVDSNTPTQGDDVLRGTEFDDVIDGMGGNDRIYGRGGNDVLIGGPGNDMLDGGPGDDELRGGPGSDTYRFGRGDGHDTIIEDSWDPADVDRIELKAGVAPGDVHLSRVRDPKNWWNVDDLVLTIVDTGETITVKKHFVAGHRHAIEEIVFADGTVWDAEEIRSRVLIGGDGDDELIGFHNRDDVIVGNAGDDVLRGLSGSDTYRFGRGDGHDTIIEDSWNPADVDRIELKAGVAPGDVHLARVRDPKNWWSVDDLVLTIVDTGETITVKKHFIADHRHAIEEIVFADGTVWDAEEIRSRVLIGDDGDDELIGFNNRDNVIVGGAGNDTLIGSSGNDTLVAGPGTDILRGGRGSDVYRFGLGDGFNTIEEGYDPEATDVVEFAEGITPEDVTVRFTRELDMTVTLPDGTMILVRNQAVRWAAGNGTGIEELRFADGTVWDRAVLAERAVVGTDGDDNIVSGYDDDTLDGGAGNDTFFNLGGYDTYHFGSGDGHDTIEGGRGKIVFKEGIDQLGVSFVREGNDLIATVDTTGDTIRIRNWVGTWSGGRIDRFEFANGAVLTASEVTTLLNVESHSEILYGSPGDDLIIGSPKNSTIYGREGNDKLIGGGGNNRLYGEAGDDWLEGGEGNDILYGGEGNDTLIGGAGRDTLYGGPGVNTYVMQRGSGLDTVYASSGAVADDTVVFGPGVRIEDISVQMGRPIWSAQPGDVGFMEMVVGFGGDDALIIRNENWNDLGRGAVRRFRFEDGTELSLEEMVPRADGGVMGSQWREQGAPPLLLGSAADDWIEDYTGDSVVVRAGANDDYVYLAGGDNIVSAGSGNDTVYTGFGNDVIAGEAGDDVIDGGAGDDTFLFNYGDGHDVLTAGDGLDTLSFGGGITSDMLGVYFATDGRLVVSVDGGAGGAVTLAGVTKSALPGDLERLQFIDADGRTRIFDFAAWVTAHSGALVAASSVVPLAFVAEAYELTGTVAPAGGLEAVAYAQTGDLFAPANLPNNTPTDGNDVIYGTPGDDVIDAVAGNNIIMGLAGNDTIYGGDGDDLIYGGDGDDLLFGGAGNNIIYGGRGADTLRGGPGRDELYGEWGGDTYLYHSGDEEVIIDDDHRVLSWGNNYGGGNDYGGVVAHALSEMIYVSEYDYGGHGDYGGGTGYGGIIIDDAPNVLEFGPGIRPEDLRYSQRDGDLVIEFAGRPDDRVILRGYAPQRATQTRSVDIIRFSDGTEIVADTIEATGITETLGDEGGWLSGTQFADTLIGGEGNDYFESPGGSDLLVGGVGSDTYRIHREWGVPAAHVTIVETWREDDVNRLELTGNVNAADLQLVFDDGDLLLMLGEDGSSVRFAGFDPRAPGMQAPVDDISLPWQGVNLSFDDLLARGVRYGDHIPNIYEVNLGDGMISIEDVAVPDAGNVLRFGPGIESDALRDNLRFEPDGEGGHVLLLHYGGEGDVVRLSGFNPEDVLGGGHAVDRYEFADGTALDYSSLVSGGFIVEGDEGDNVIYGSNLDDRLYGHDGDDVLRGGEGNDVLVGGRGNNILIGGDGDDAYFFNKGDGIDTIIDSGITDFNFIQFGANIRPEDIHEEWDGTTLILHYSDGDAVRIKDFHSDEGNPAIVAIVFEDGTVISLAERMNRAPIVNGQLEDAVALEGQDFHLVLPADLFSDPDPSDDLQITVRLAGGDPLPEWLTFDPATNTLSGQPMIDDVGEFDVVVEARDHFGATVSAPLRFTVEAANNAPEVAIPIDDQQAAQNETFSFVVPDNTFNDVDVNDVLTLSATQADGSALPDWLVFDAATGTFSGTPTNDDVGSISLKLTATDLAGASVSQNFMLDIISGNLPPVTAPDTATVIEDRKLLAWGNVLANDFDPEGEKLRVADPGIRQGEYGWLTLLPNGSYAYVLNNCSSDVQGLGGGEMAIDRFSYIASDGTHKTDGELAVTVLGTNDKPELSKPLANVQLARGEDFAWQIPAGSFTDRDRNDILTYTATLKNGKALPDWLTFDAATQTFSGTTPTRRGGNVHVRVVAGDGHSIDSIASDVFRVRIGNRMELPSEGNNFGVNNVIHSFGADLIGNLTQAASQYLSDADINQIIQDVAGYAVTEGIALGSINDVLQHNDLMTMVANSWQAA